MCIQTSGFCHLSHEACKLMAMSIANRIMWTLLRTEGSVVAGLEAVSDGAQVHGPRDDGVVAGRLLLRDRLSEQGPHFAARHPSHHSQRRARLPRVQPLPWAACGEKQYSLQYSALSPSKLAEC